jgi:hypothetical protein
MHSKTIDHAMMQTMFDDNGDAGGALEASASTRS